MRFFLSAALAVLFSFSARANEPQDWQQIVCHIASAHLDEATKVKFAELIGGPYTPQAFVAECSQPMGVRGARSGKFKNLQNESQGLQKDPDTHVELAIHATRNLPPIAYIDLPRNTLRIENFDCPDASPCLLAALIDDTNILMGSEVAPSDRKAAANRLGWHLARLHFPLSFGFSDDLGGHWVRVGGVESCARNLNDFWAKCTWKLGAKAHGVDKKNITQYAALLQSEITPEQAKKWVSGSNLLTWANQSYRIATSNRMGYCVWKKEQCRYSEEKLAFDPNGQLYDQYSRKVFFGTIGGTTGGVKTQGSGVHSMTYKKLLLDDEYQSWAVAVTETRLKQAGVRLAAFLAASL